MTTPLLLSRISRTRSPPAFRRAPRSATRRRVRTAARRRVLGSAGRGRGASAVEESRSLREGSSPLTRRPHAPAPRPRRARTRRRAPGCGRPPALGLRFARLLTEPVLSSRQTLKPLLCLVPNCCSVKDAATREWTAYERRTRCARGGASPLSRRRRGAPCSAPASLLPPRGRHARARRAARRAITARAACGRRHRTRSTLSSTLVRTRLTCAAQAVHRAPARQGGGRAAGRAAPLLPAVPEAAGAPRVLFTRALRHHLTPAPHSRWPSSTAS